MSSGLLLSPNIEDIMNGKQSLRRLILMTHPRLLLGILVFMASLGPAWAQVTAAISGHVEDGSGAVVSDATVTVKNLETGAIRVVTTDTAGNFRVL